MSSHQCIVTKEVPSSAHHEQEKRSLDIQSENLRPVRLQLSVGGKKMADLAGRVVQHALFEALKKRSSQWIIFFWPGRICATGDKTWYDAG